jgi:hypothetical protein
LLNNFPKIFSNTFREMEKTIKVACEALKILIAEDQKDESSLV